MGLKKVYMGLSLIYLRNRFAWYSSFIKNDEYGVWVNKFGLPTANLHL